MQYYDIIGDIHGHADALEILLQKLGYEFKNNIYQHKAHKVIFLGDFIDRGPQQRAVIDIVKPMIQNGSALSVMGNHEFNAICYGSKDIDGNPLRKHSEKNTKQHDAFLGAYPDEKERMQIIDWFKSLPIYIETDGIRVIHASWNDQYLADISPLLDENNCLTIDSYPECSKKDSIAYLAIETLLKGPEVRLPETVTFKDKDGNERNQARFKWWLSEQYSLEERLHLGDGVTNKHKLSELEIEDGFQYSETSPPVFVGHYWLNIATPEPLSNNVACVDYSVAKDGKLVAYKWRGEKVLTANNFEW